MANFLDAALRVLTAEGRPMTARELTERAVSNGWLVTKGATPHHTMRARLSDDIRLRHDQSVFMRTESGMFALRAWTDHLEEFVADRFQRALLEEDAVVFDATLLSQYVPTPGLQRAPLAAGRDLLAACRPMLRREAEEDRSVIQLVSAFVLRLEDKYLTYRRTKRLPESRLHGEYSVHFGGHITPGDLTPTHHPADAASALFNLFDPNEGLLFLQRELAEEVRLPRQPHFQYRGLVYDDRREVSRQHLGIVYDVFLTVPTYTIGERGFLMDDRFETLDEIESRIGAFENWSELLVRDERAQRSAS